MDETLKRLLKERFDAPQVYALVLMGSYARGDAGPFSDIDLVRFVDNVGQTEPQSYLIEDKLVVVSEVAAEQVEAWFIEPEQAVEVISGLRLAKALVDRDQAFEQIQARAQAFEWDSEMQRKANQWASKQMVGWIEEVHKGFEGLRRNDVGRLLNSRHGGSWGMTKVMCVQRGILLSGDNAFFDTLEEVMGAQSDWLYWRRIAFGVTQASDAGPSLREQVIAGLRLYALTAEMLGDILLPKDKPLVFATVKRIQNNVSKAAD
ncbi:MAG: nucleotidyltransferase domain-containing protein [Pseudomonadota bacterium]